MMSNVTEQLAAALAEMTGIAETDNLDSASNVWRSAIVNANEALARYDAEGDTDGAMWRKHKNSFKVLEAMLDAASPLVLNRLKAEEAVKDSQHE